MGCSKKFGIFFGQNYTKIGMVQMYAFGWLCNLDDLGIKYIFGSRTLIFRGNEYF